MPGIGAESAFMASNLGTNYNGVQKMQQLGKRLGFDICTFLDWIVDLIFIQLCAEFYKNT